MSDVLKGLFNKAGSIPRRRVARWLLLGGAFVVVGWLFWNARAALFPFQIGIVLAYLILPLVNFIDRMQFIPRWLAIFIVYLSGLLLFIGALTFVVPLLINQINQLTQVTESLPEWSDIQVQAAEWLEFYEQKIPETIRSPVEREVEHAITSFQEELAIYVQNAILFLINSALQVINTLTFLLGFIFVPFWMFYVMHDERAGRAALNAMLPPRTRADFWAVVTIMDRVFSSYIRGQLLMGIIVGSAVGAGLVVLNMLGFNVPYVLLLAVFAGVTELVPYIGPTIGATPAVILALFDSPSTAILVVLLYMSVQAIENNLLFPRIIGDSVGIHPAILMVVMVMCSQVFGFIGIILAAPLAAVVRDVFCYTHGRLSEPPRPAGVLPAICLQASTASDTEQHEPPEPEPAREQVSPS